ncbi:MAG: cytosine permease [Candidatus Hecatellales archaeon]|nr:MAG: cytosine permease [Candidatus Hecatellales archaeon]
MAEQRKRLVDYEREPVPEEKRRSWLEMASVWAGIAACLAALMFGGVMGYHFTIYDAIIATALGYVISTTINILTGIVGYRTGLSTAFISRFAFGNYGSGVIALVLALGTYGWFAVQTGMFGETANAAYQMITGQSWSVLGFIIVGGILMTFTAVIGYRGIAYLSIIAVPLMFILMVGSLFMVLQTHPWEQIVNTPPPGPPLPLGVGISIAAGTFMVGAVIGPDIYRYAKKPSHVVGAALVGFFAATVSIVTIGAILSHAVGEWDLVKIMITLGWGPIAMFFLIIAQWTTNDNNLYSAALALANVFRSPKWPKWKLTIIAGALGIALAAAGIYGQFVNWLMFLSAIIPGIGGVYIVDFAINRHLYSWDNIGKVRLVRPLALLAWIIGSLIGVMTTAPPIGLGLFQLTTISALDALLVAAALQAVFSLLQKGSSNPL